MIDARADERRPALRTPTELARTIVAALHPGRRLLVALDHDGTLSPIAPRPSDAALAAGAADALEELGRAADVVVISGRGLDDLVHRIGRLPVHIVSEHGLRLRDRQGRVTALTGGLAPRDLGTVREHVGSLLTADRLAEGWILEDKGVGLAVHHRLVAPDRVEPTLSAVRDAMRAVPGARIQEGKAVIELRAAGADKGAALRHLIAAWRPGLTVMIGDDRTDEPAFATAESEGGIGVLVSTEDAPSSGSIRLTDPDDVVVLLGALAQRFRQGR